MALRTPLDVPLALFGLTALVAASLAYNPVAAWNKAWLILCGVLLCAAIARQPGENLWPIAGGLATLAGVLAIALLLARLAAALAIARQWPWRLTTVDTLFGSQAMDAIQGILTMLLAFPVVVAVYGLGHRRKWLGPLAGAASVATVLGLVSTGSMSALWSLLGGCGLACVLGLRALRRNSRRAALALMAAAALGVFLVGAIGAARLVRWKQSGMAGAWPGVKDVLSRAELARQSRYLIEDYLWTGAGLASFPGQYSQYIMAVPVLSQESSHNVYIDVALEQGAIGFIASAWVWGVSIRLLVSRPRPAGVGEATLLAAATFCGLCLVALHGLAEDALYGTWAVPFLFILPGFAAAMEGHGSKRADGALLALRSALPRPAGRRPGPLLVAIAVTLIVLAVGFGGAIVSSMQANLGALAMARQQLSGWPTGEWDEGHDATNLQPAEAWFTRALASNAENRSAHYRLGLISLLRRDFEGAVDHLARAAQLSPGHRGVRKSLGFALCWAGSLEEATRMLAGIPEARQELETYVWWWGNHGRPDLASQAQQLASRLPPP